MKWSFKLFLFFRDITTMKGTIVAQVDSSESFQEFCSTSCLSLYEDKQSPAKGALNKSRCTICGKLTEVCTSVLFTFSYKKWVRILTVFLYSVLMHASSEWWYTRLGFIPLGLCNSSLPRKLTQEKKSHSIIVLWLLFLFYWSNNVLIYTNRLTIQERQILVGKHF